MSNAEGEKIIADAVKKVKCTLVSCVFEDGNVTITVKQTPESTIAQVGYEPNWRAFKPVVLELRVRRFVQHYVLRKPYYTNQMFSSI